MTFFADGQFIISELPLLAQKLFEQIILVTIAVLLAIGIGLPLSVFVKHIGKWQKTILGTASVLQTIPSLALLAALLPFFGIGMKPAIMALTLYAVLPIIRNTVTGLQQIPPHYLEIARGLGFTKLQRLTLIELPLAAPVIIAGIRTAITMTVGIATIAAFIGAGGLGDFINRGLAMNNNLLLLLGAIPAALLALTLDALFGIVEKALSRPLSSQHPKIRWHIPAMLSGFLLALLVTGSGFYYTQIFPEKNTAIIRIGTKNFTEQYILGEILSQIITANTHLKVEKFFNLGTTAICQRAMERGDIDIYPEYTGTAYLTVLHQTAVLNPAVLFRYVQKSYEKQYDIIWLPPFGFNNSQSLAVRERFALQHHLNTISDLATIAPHLTLAAPPEFRDRVDGLGALQKGYGLHFAALRSMDAGLMYQAVFNHEVDLITAYSTDGRIPAYHLRILTDDKSVFPAYQAAPLVRQSTLKAHPELRPVLLKLAGELPYPVMQKLNYLVDVKGESPEKVAHDFLVRQHDI